MARVPVRFAPRHARMWKEPTFFCDKRSTAKTIRFAALMAILIWSTVFVGGDVTMGEDFSARSRFVRVLTAPMNSVLDGTPFRSGLQSIAAQAGLNLWLDRQVNPSIAIDAGPLGPNVFAAIEKLAASQACVVMPVMDVVLVGRPTWVDHTASALLAIPETKLGDRIDVAWPDLTTSQEAFRQVTGGADGNGPILPYDLWPAVNWQQIERQVAIALVLAQFDVAQLDALTPESGLSSRNQPTFTRRYSPGTVSLADFRVAMATHDPSSQARIASGWIVARGNIEAHRAATKRMLAQAGDVAGPDPDRDTFTLKRMTTSAENALNQLARTAGKTCVIEPDAAEACKQVISVEGHEMSLRQLIDMVAKQAGVTASWQDNKIVIAATR